MPDLVDDGCVVLADHVFVVQFPERLEVVDVLPRNTLGKVLKNDLRARFGDGRTRSLSGPDRG